MKEKIESYLLFLTGIHFTYSEDDKSCVPRADIPQNIGAIICSLNKKKALKYDVKFNEEGRYLTSLFNINPDVLETAVSQKMEADLYHFADLLTCDVVILKTEFGLKLLIAYSKNTEQIIKSKFSKLKTGIHFTNLIIDGQSYISILFYDITKVEACALTSISTQLDFLANITRHNFNKINVDTRDPGNPLCPRGRKTYLQSTPLAVSDLYTQWLKKELDWLSEQGYFKLRDELNENQQITFILESFDDDKAIIYKETSPLKISLLDSDPKCYYRDAISFSNCLSVLLGGKWTISLSGCFFSDSVDDKSYVEEKLNANTSIFSYELTKKELNSSYRVKIKDKAAFLLLVVQKMFLGANYLSVISGNKILFTFVYEKPNTIEQWIDCSKTIQPQFVLYPDQVQQLEKYLSKEGWFNEKRLYEIASKALNNKIELLESILDTKFETLLPPLNYCDPECTDIMHALKREKAYKLKDRTGSYVIKYTTNGLEPKKYKDLISKITRLEEANVIVRCNRPDSSLAWHNSNNNNNTKLGEIILQICDENKLLEYAKKLNQTQSQDTGNNKECSVM